MSWRLLSGPISTTDRRQQKEVVVYKNTGGRQIAKWWSVGWRPSGTSHQTNTSTVARCSPRKRPGFQHPIKTVFTALLRQLPLSTFSTSENNVKTLAVHLSCLCFEACRQSHLCLGNDLVVEYIHLGLCHVNTVVHLSSLLNVSLYSSLK